MTRLTQLYVWLSRITHCRGFGIQSPNDYQLVRYVINEHWPYYKYAETGTDGDWLTKKLGRLYFRLANWRQPAVVIDQKHSPFWNAGCQRTAVTNEAPRADIIRLALEGDYRSQMHAIYNKVDEHSLLVIEGIWSDKRFWREVAGDPRTGVTFDLYYCGIVMFDKSREKKSYIINF